MAISSNYLQSRLDTNATRLKGLNHELAGWKRKGTIYPNIPVSLHLSEDAEEVIPGVAITRIERQDFVMDRADLEANGIGAPQVADEIIRSNGEVYRILSMGGSEPPHRHFTSSRKRVRVHTELVRAGT